MSSSNAGETIRWDLDPDALSLDACRRANRTLTVGEMRTYLGEMTARSSCAAMDDGTDSDEPTDSN